MITIIDMLGGEVIVSKNHTWVLGGLMYLYLKGIRMEKGGRSSLC